jgi:hypothetical protein
LLDGASLKGYEGLRGSLVCGGDASRHQGVCAE